MSTTTAIFAIIAAFGFVFVAIGATLLSGTARFRRTATGADATLVALEAVTSEGAGSSLPIGDAMMIDRTSVTYRPTVEFMTRDGEHVRATSPIASNPAPGRVGDSVRVLYDPGDPQRIRLDTRRGRGGCLAWGLLAFGMLPLVVGVIGLVSTAH
ncbi:MAG: DUF3592 domain-containing protein [Solirubrobacterales bacterium]|nr:DUF3592 domain-containing protein [Solirubrobacterales bacterium]MBV9368084.1 DUF3592 domain-containing protein [Solirubrobacterales bacterium]MBV9684570.1 DUF3592 domain-containing protein [Solirubrobacterales bacterium]MBV9809402.1 DUF3592 domain-containing protein [Solirubrobacterales bacterium]